jgi:uncharacterized protein YecT (DUF1311 family)
MAFFLALAMAGGVAAAAAANSKPCPGDTTRAIEACLESDARNADADLARYVAAARARLTREAKGEPGNPQSARALAGLDRAEAAWALYRKAECDAIYAWWEDGTIRGAMSETCWTGLTRLHTHTIWRDWLTYMDSTPPILPEPDVSPEE